MPKILVKRGTRAQIEAAAGAGQLAEGEPYLMTDESRLAIGTTSSAYAEAALRGEGQLIPWLKRAGRYRIAGLVDAAAMSGSLATVASRQLFIPFSVPRLFVLAKLGIFVSISSAGTADLGVYGTRSVAGNEEPGDLLAATASSINTGGTGYKESVLLSPLTLVPGTVYWASLLCSATPGFYGVNIYARAAILPVSAVNIYTYLYTDGVASLPASAGATLESTNQYPPIYLVEA